MPSWTQIPEGPSSVFCMLTSSMENGKKCSNCLKDGRLSKKQDATTMFPPLSSNQVLHTDVHVRHLHITNTHTHTFHVHSIYVLSHTYLPLLFLCTLPSAASTGHCQQSAPGDQGQFVLRESAFQLHEGVGNVVAKPTPKMTL